MKAIKMKALLKKLLSKNLYESLRLRYRLLRPIKRYNSVNESSLRKNEQLFVRLGFDIDSTKELMFKVGCNFEDPNLSWHYHIFAGWYDYCERNGKKVDNILEIGTHNASFTSYLSKLYTKSKIHSIDLPDSDVQFNTTYGRDNFDQRAEFLKLREKNLDAANISFYALNSINIAKVFKGMKFDAIWVDGDHHDPQVTIDLINSINLLSDDGILCNDDVIMNIEHEKDNYVSNESYVTLELLAKNDFVENQYVIKRTRNSVSNVQKYVSISKLIEPTS